MRLVAIVGITMILVTITLTRPCWRQRCFSQAAHVHQRHQPPRLQTLLSCLPLQARPLPRRCPHPRRAPCSTAAWPTTQRASASLTLVFPVLTSARANSLRATLSVLLQRTTGLSSGPHSSPIHSNGSLRSPRPSPAMIIRSCPARRRLCGAGTSPLPRRLSHARVRLLSASASGGALWQPGTGSALPAVSLPLLPLPQLPRRQRHGTKGRWLRGKELRRLRLWQRRLRRQQCRLRCRLSLLLLMEPFLTRSLVPLAPPQLTPLLLPLPLLPLRLLPLQLRQTYPRLSRPQRRQRGPKALLLLLRLRSHQRRLI